MTLSVAHLSESGQSPKSPKRGVRRAAATRAKLLRAAMELMGQRGLDNVTITEITDRACVGVGSFYNHFGTRDALQQAVLQDMIGAFGAAVDASFDADANPLAVMAAAARLAYRRAMDDTAWGWFLIRSSERGGLATRGLGRRLRHDLARAADKNLINPPNIDHLAIGLAGLVLSFISAGLHGDINSDDDHAVALTLLHAAGVGGADAAIIAQQPLPILKEE